MRFIPERISKRYTLFKQVAAHELAEVQQQGWVVVAVLRLLDRRDNVLAYHYLVGSTADNVSLVAQLQAMRDANTVLTRDLYVHQKQLARIRAALGAAAYDQLLADSRGKP